MTDKQQNALTNLAASYNKLTGRVHEVTNEIESISFVSEDLAELLIDSTVDSLYAQLSNRLLSATVEQLCAVVEILTSEE